MPTVSSVHVNAALTSLAISYKNYELVWDRIFPIVPVAKESDTYFVFNKEELQDEDALRAAGAEAREITWDVTTATYTAQEYTLRHLLADRIIANADVAVRPEISTVNKLMRKILLGTERRTALLCQNTVNVGTAATPSIKWDGTSPTIEKDIDTAKDTVRLAIGTEPTSIMLPYKVKNAVKRDSTIRDLIRYNITPPDILLRNGELPPVIFNLEVIIAGAIRNTANEGQTESLGDVWTDNSLVFYKEPNPGLEALSYGYTFRVQTPIVKKYRVDTRGGVMIEVGVTQTEKVTASSAGYLLTDLLT
jgi:hypothetical protein